MAEGTPKNSRIQKRGDPEQLSDEVPRKFLDLLGGQQVVATNTSGRLELAQWLTSPTNPLTARVMVNRIWQWHFGRGLVPTPNDFGTRGQPPTHPELLDWLACEFRKSGWSVKHLHRLIMSSATYQQSSVSSLRAGNETSLFRQSPEKKAAAVLPHNTGTSNALQGDANNDLYSRFYRRRLTVVRNDVDERAVGSPSKNSAIRSSSLVANSIPRPAKHIHSRRKTSGISRSTRHSPPSTTQRNAVFTSCKSAIAVRRSSPYSMEQTQTRAPPSAMSQLCQRRRSTL